ncbi:MAG: hypothetical protein JWM28_845 [Chitinophagaceae bacterium]|nr:hypothetical protein [Chitinophagaceae bacterium]
MGSIILRGAGFSYTGNQGKHVAVDNGEVNIETENIVLTAQPGQSWDWSALIKNVFVKNLNHFAVKNKGILTLQDVAAKNINLSSATIKNIPALLNNNNAFQLTNSGGNYVDREHIFNWDNLSFDQNSHTLSVDGLNYQPALSRDSLVAAYPYQVDYITARTGRMQLLDVDLAAYINDSILKAGRLVIEQPIITAYRDATKPFRHGYLKSLPTVAIRKIPPFFSLDAIELNDATVTYLQVDKKTLKTGTIPVTHLTTSLSTIRNYDLKETDSLELNAEGLLMDKIPVKLRVRESYDDSLAGFSLFLHISPAGLSILNPVLVPLVSAKLKSGWLDSLFMQVNADEYASIGEMKMNYRNLKIAVLKKGNENDKTLVTRLANFAANTFFLRHKNSKRTGAVYFERNRERSFFNYLVKMTISGIANSAGIKKDKKKIRRYQREKTSTGNQKKTGLHVGPASLAGMNSMG